MTQRFFNTGLLVLLTLFSIRSFSQGHNIEIQIDGMAGDTAVIGYHFGSKKFAHDTLVFSPKGKITVAGDKELTKGVYFIYNPRYYFEFLVWEQQFKLNLKKEEGYRSLTVTGSKENELFRDFQLTMGGYQKELTELSNEFKNMTGEDSVRMRERLVEKERQMQAFQQDIVSSNPGTLMSQIAAMIKGVTPPDSLDQAGKYRYTKNHYFDFMSSPADLMRTPMFIEYVDNYFSKIVPPLPDSVSQEIDRWIERCRPNHQVFNYWLGEFLKKYQTTEIMGFDAVWIHLIETYCLTGQADWMDDKLIKKLQEEVRFIKPNLIGSPAPSFYAVDTLLRPINLSTLKSKYLVLMFYDPDCGHCKKKVPELNKIKADIRSLGGEIVGICVTTEVDKWKKFIREQNLDWVNLADPQAKSDFRVNYNTRTTPQLYLLDQDRKIIGKNLGIEDQLVDYLKWYDKKEKPN